MVRTTEEIKLHLPANATFDINNLLPFLTNHAAPELIVQVIGQNQYDALLLAYESNSLTTQQEALHKKVCYPLVNYGFAKYLPTSQVSISNSGIHIEVGDNKKTAFEWQVKSVQNSFLEAAANGVEQLYLFLEKNRANYPLWTASTACSLELRNFINSATDFNNIYNIGNSRRTFMALRNTLTRVEDESIKALLGEDYYTELKAAVKAGSVTGFDAKLLTIIQTAIAHLTIAEAVTTLDVTLTADGIRMNQLVVSEEKTKTETERLSALEKKNRGIADAWLKKAKDFIYNNVDEFPTFKDSETYVDPTTNEDWDQSDNGIVSF